MKQLQTFQVLPNIPKPLLFLETLSTNIWWSWQYDAVDLFRRIDPRRWNECHRNPILFLNHIPQARLKELAEDHSYLSHVKRVQEMYDMLPCRQMSDYNNLFHQQGTIAYFSMEFGIHESIPLFAGGLGILAGDHLKAASDMSLPLVGVGLLYRQGYFRQFMDQDGWQQEEYPETDIYQLPIEKAVDYQGEDIVVSIDGPFGKIYAAVWRLNVGCVPLYLLDTNLSENSREIREITAQLYIGDQRMRISQEMVLGIGGMRALEALGIHPSVCHMNEGHSAFSSLERLAQIIKTHKVDLKTALEIVPRTTIFTTHTPVAAGNEEFPADLIKPYLIPLEQSLGTTADEMISWGQPLGASPESPVSMFVFGAKMAQYCNGVSKLHGEVARRMWTHVWPERPEHEIPITHVTNGVHIPSFLSQENALLFERYIGTEWQKHPSKSENSQSIDNIYDEELWRAHTMSRSRLIRVCRKLMVKQYQRRNAPKDIMKNAELVLDQDVLTIAFARRFATYKRANLLLNEPDRFEAILSSNNNPVQFVFAGKAHPRDHEGKELIKRLIHFARKTNVRHRMIFLEDYDIYIARHLVQGADVWLNTPRRPFEACGTSGMKAAINGVLNVSILDGWWCEGYSEDRGWSIGNGEEYSDSVYQDSVESRALYNLLENEVIPRFYDRKTGDVPVRWVKMMKESMKMGMRIFCSHRMVAEYNERFYTPATNHLHNLLVDDARESRELALKHERYKNFWKDVKIEQPELQVKGPFKVGDTFQASTIVNLGELRPDEVEVELYFGVLKSVDTLPPGQAQHMQMLEAHGNGQYLYSCNVKCRYSGRYGFTARVVPRGDYKTRFEPGLITWS
ncbi:Putative glycogen phosphorylase [Desulfonema limicola]|uniref:Glycogen phosphorylase n=1 Tax=Desulfonema limicola TaxID=45656 RepID=A0A975BB43_9BACT|nr:alpha-glucan family phosphorylase [Desulfonema limicola]QTA82178.1 Putative glycogen phosphorylase [Desulfonema limicola]